MNCNSFFKSAVIAIVAFALAYGCYKLSGDFLSHQNFSWKIFSKNEKFEQSIDFSGINEIQTNSENNNLYFNTSSSANEKNGKVKFNGIKDQVQVSKQNQVLTVTLRNFKNYSDSSISIALPKQVKIVKVENRAGNTIFDKVFLTALSIHSVSGDIQLQQSEIDSATLVTVNGNITGDGKFQKMTANTVSGNININSSFDTPEYDFKSVSGNIDLNFSQPVNAQLQMQSQKGNVSTTNSINIAADKKHGFVRAVSVTGDITVNGNNK